tara:strand:+ start:806 stop:1156 length:351 start_codon:yes stop_codon:yes gene_type:complete
MIINGCTEINTVKEFVDTLTDGKQTNELKDDIEVWIKNQYSNYSKGLLGVIICSNREVQEYTWSFGQRTIRRLSNFKKKYEKYYDIEEEGGDILLLSLRFGSAYDDEEDVLRELIN